MINGIKQLMISHDSLSPDDKCLRWLYVDMNSFFASCEQQSRPELRGKPLIIVPVMAETTCAIAASYEAKFFGIKTGIPVWQARKLCPQLIMVQARPKLYVHYHHKIIAAIEVCLPIEAVMSIDEMACRLDKVQSQPQIAESLADDIQSSLRERVGECLTCSIGIASNRLLAKLASDMKKPNGLVVLHPSTMPQAILHLKPGDICGIGRNMAERLSQAGIHDMPALWAADAQQLKRVWQSIVGLRFHALLHGDDLPNPLMPRRSLGHQHVLAPNERTKQQATQIIRQLLIRAAQRLREDGFYSSRLILHIKWVHKAGYHSDEASFKECQDTSYLLTVLETLWQRVPNNLQLLRIGVTLTGLKAQAEHQPDLFDVPKPANLTKAVDALNSRYGHGTVNFGAVMAPMTSKIAFQRVPKLTEF